LSQPRLTQANKEDADINALKADYRTTCHFDV
jgi:hypothetical protein